METNPKANIGEGRAINPAYRALLADFVREAGLQDVDQFLETEEVIVDGLAVSLYYEGDENLGEVVIFSLLGVPDAAHLPQIAQVLLEANYLWAGTGGATLGLSPENHQVISAVRLPLDTLTAEALASIIDAFVDTAAFWKRWIAGAVDGQEPFSYDHEMDSVGLRV